MAASRTALSVRSAVALAQCNGWRDDSAWTRSTVTEQRSLEREGHLACVTVSIDGAVSWRIQDLDRGRCTGKGTTATVAGAQRECERVLASLAGVLF